MRLRLRIVLTFALLGLSVPLLGEPARIAPGSTVKLSATAYCLDGTTSSGMPTRHGIVAADPVVLAVGSVIRITDPGASYAGIYTVLDTGSAVKGRRIDIFMGDCARAGRFGRRLVHVHVLRQGWDPRASTTSSSSPQ